MGDCLQICSRVAPLLLRHSGSRDKREVIALSLVPSEEGTPGSGRDCLILGRDCLIRGRDCLTP